MQSKRIFIGGAAISSNEIGDYPYPCEADTAFYDPYGTGAAPPKDFYDIPPTGTVGSVLINGGRPLVPTRILYGLGGVIRGYIYTTIFCADCRIRGTTVQPSFWID